MTLFPKDSVEDLVLRGFSRNEILSRTGFDPGYNNAKLKTALSGIDRMAYKIEFILSQLSQAELLDILEQYAQGSDKTVILTALGLGSEQRIFLKDLFPFLGLFDEFQAADKCYRRSNMVNGFQDIYQTDNPFKLSQFQDRAAATREEKYGAAYTLQKGSSLEAAARQKVNETIQSEECKANRRAALQEKYGVDSTLKLPEVRAKAKATMVERYGVESYAQLPEMRDAARQRIRSNDFHKKSVATCLQNYGVAHYSQTEEARYKQSVRMKESHGWATLRKAHGTLNTSKPEQALYDILVARFGTEDVVREYQDDHRYPFACDFYIKSRDLFIELNAHWSHGGHWFSESDKEKLTQWLEAGTQYYHISANTWSRRDVEKRNVAAQANLNYVVFWTSDLSDVYLWLDMDCPDGRDWEREYSWVPDSASDTADN